MMPDSGPWVYVASRLENAEAVRALMAALSSRGVEITYDWTEHGSVQGQGAERMREVARSEAAGVELADLAVVLLPGGRGTHTEIGIAIGAGVPVLLVGEQPGDYDCAFYHHPGVTRTNATGDALVDEIITTLRAEAIYDWL